MNFLHHRLCRSAGWKKTVEQRIPWVLSSTDLGRNVLELGPGPGLTTDLLRLKAQKLTSIEVDSGLADSLRSRLSGSNVEVVTGDATAMPFADEEFTSSVSLTMLHHVPSPELQDKLLREVRRVIKRGGFFLGSDSLPSLMMHLIHWGDTFVPVRPEAFAARLQAAGFEVLEIERGPKAFRFRARRPA